ncbi:RHS repeat-associated core domain-containing protein [Catenulispora rubra]|uniref:RHS repeat-associated core domain-containing protein n=1 Tax=Catenulispora rubra TaxID=280293 RepID=UPI001891FF50|nr:RHS repeat-associated core domain-containing protein [Catenulispora rubra]
MRTLGGLTAAALSLGVLTANSSGARAKLGGPPKPGKYNGHALDLGASTPGKAWTAKPVKAPTMPKGATVTPPVFPAAATVDISLPSAKAAGALAATTSSGVLSRVPGTPVLVGTASAGALGSADVRSAVAPASVRVTVADRAHSIAAGANGVVVSVARTDGQTVPGAADVAVDYSAFAQAFGGDYGDRLELVSLPACALTTPQLAACKTQTPIRFTHDWIHQQLIADVALPASRNAADPASNAAAPALVLAATSASSGPTGTYTATSLSASNSWSSGNNAGSFQYSYPITVPPSLGTGAPTVALSYDSGSVDGKTTAENGEPSWIGDGWDYSPGFIERSYSPCSKAKPTAFANNSESCFALDANGNQLPALTLSFEGHGGQLVYDDSDTSYTHFKLATDDGTQIDRLTGAVNNGTSNGEFYRVHTPDGTTAYFGADQFPVDAGGVSGKGPESDSAWTEPVFNDPNNTLCKNPATAITANCMQAWRWNLDYVVDPHGNVTEYSYIKEIGYYGHGTNSVPVAYDRGGVLNEIDYGWQRSDTINQNPPPNLSHEPAAKVLFNTANRCVDPNADDVYSANPVGGSNGAGPPGCGAVGFGQSFSGGMLDTPTDQACSGAATSCTNTFPTFWSTRRLASIDTEVALGGTYKPVDHYDLFDQFHNLDTTTATTGSLMWLAAIRHCAASAMVSGSLTCPAAKENGTANQATLPDVQFIPTANQYQRVPGVVVPPGDQNLPGFQRERMGTIYDELGAATTVGYDDPRLNTTTGQSNFAPLGCTAPPASVDWHNHQLCFQEYWTPPGTSAPITDWFQKYVVTSVMVADETGTSNNVVTNYSYDTTQGAAWHSNDSDLVTDPASRTYDQYRGFAKVTTTVGQPGDVNHPQTQSVTQFLRGMDQDPDKTAETTHSCGTGGADCPGVSVSDDLSGVPTVDDNALAGFPLETQTLTGAGGSAWITTVTKPWKSDPQATHARDLLPPLRSRQLGTAQTITAAPLASGGTRITQSLNYYNEAEGGRLVLTDKLAPVLQGGGAVPGDSTPETCSYSAYSASTQPSWISAPVYLWMNRASEQVQQAAPCNFTNLGAVYSGLVLALETTSPLNGTVLSSARTFYDNATNFPSPVTIGDATRTEAATSQASGVPGGWLMQSAATFDNYGRTLTNTNALNATTSTAYAPTAGSQQAMELPVLVKTEGPDPGTGHPSAAWTSTTTADPSRTAGYNDITDVNGRVTHTTYDALGRTVAAWGPDHPQATYPNQPDSRTSYVIYGHTPGSTSQPSTVETDTLRDNGSYLPSVSYFDSLGRTRQTQTLPSSDDPGRVVTDTNYDTVGRTNIVSGPYYDGSHPPGSGMWTPTGSELHQSQTYYDGLGRTTDVLTLSNSTELWRSHTSYAGADRSDVIPPVGGVRTSTVTDARGLTRAVYTYHSTDPTAVPWASTDPTKVDTKNVDITSYGYDAAGRQNQVTDADGAVWQAAYDLLGRKTESSDPDTGSSHFTYDNVGDIRTTTDSRGTSLYFGLDFLGRKTVEYQGTNASGTELASWTYDAAPPAPAPASDGKGNLGLTAWSKRYTPGASAPYMVSVAGYDPDGRPLGTSVTIPSGDGNGALAGTYTTTNHYTAMTGLLHSSDLPAAGNPATGGLAANTLTYGYNYNGLLISSGDNYADLLTDSAFSPYGLIQRRVLGDYPSQVVADTTYDPATQRVANTTISQLAWNAPIDTTAYTYNPAGQITAEVDNQGTAQSISNGLVSATPATDAQCFTYGYAGRLATAWTDTGNVTGTVFGSVNNATGTANPADPTSLVPGALGGCAHTAPAAGNIGGPAPYWQQYTVDPAGNRTAMAEYNTAGTLTVNHTYAYGVTANGVTAQPHTLTSASINGTASAQYTYDSAGNTKIRAVNGTPTQNLQWDTEGRLIADSDGSGADAAYVYDADGNQLIRRDANTTTLYLGNSEIYLNNSKQTITGNCYYSDPGGPTIVESGGANPTVSYEAGNTQGTASTTVLASPPTDSTGQVRADQAVTARRDYTPFNTPRGTVNTTGQWNQKFPDDHTFLGKTTDTTTGLVDIGARKYDPDTGRFISADPVFSAGDPQTIGGYAYAANDPINASDPSGLIRAVNVDPFAGYSPNYVNPCTGEDDCLDASAYPIKECSWACTAAGVGHWIAKQGDSVLQATPINQIISAGATATVDHTITSGGANAPTGQISTPPISLTDYYDTFISTHGIATKKQMESTSNFLDVVTIVTGVSKARDAGLLAGGIRDAAKRILARSAEDCHSFAPDTRVLMADGTTKPIEDVKVGDKIENAQPGGATELHKVDVVHRTLTDTKFTDITVSTSTGPKDITGTQNHPYYDLTAGHFVNASELRPGDRLQTDRSAVVSVVAVRNYVSSMPTYDLTVDGLHTYYVVAGTAPVLVHNTISCPIKPTYVWRPKRGGVDADEQVAFTPDQVVDSAADVTPGKYIFVKRLDGSVRAMNTDLYDSTPFDVPLPGHTSLAENEAVLFAGEFEVTAGGRVTRITNTSGHLRPGSWAPAYNETDYASLGDVAKQALSDWGLTVDDNTVYFERWSRMGNSPGGP